MAEHAEHPVDTAWVRRKMSTHPTSRSVRSRPGHGPDLTDAEITAIAVGPDDRILVAATRSTLALACYLPDGTPDRSFGGWGIG